MKVAAYQAPLLPTGSLDAIDLIRERVEWCEAHGITILCCPEAILGGLADYASSPMEFAIDARGDQLARVLAPLASDTVTTIVGFTEVTGTGTLHNTAAVYHKGAVIGLYRKLHPAINRSIYEPGDQLPVFQVEGLVFGIAICNDSNYPEPARALAARGATALFVPTNNGLPPGKTSADLVDRARHCDIDRAIENRVWVIRADVAGSASGLTSDGSSAIVDRDGVVRLSGARSAEDLVVAELGDVPFHPRTVACVGKAGPVGPAKRRLHAGSKGPGLHTARSACRVGELGDGRGERVHLRLILSSGRRRLQL